MNRRHLLTGTMALGLGAAMTLRSGAATAAKSISAKTGQRSRQIVVARDGTRLFHRDFGTAGPTLVFVASWALDSRMWDPQYLYFGSRGYRCVGFDRRGHGRSVIGAIGHSMDTFADDLAAILRQLDLQNVILVGHSMGAAEIIHYLARHGHSRVRKVVLLAPVAPFVLKTPDNPYGAPLAYFQGSWDRMANDFPAWAQENQSGFFRPDTSADLKDNLTRQLLETPLPVALAAQKALVTTDLRADLPRIDVPVLILHGDKDLSAPLEITGKRLEVGIENAQLKVYPGAPHGLWVTDKEQVNADIERFARLAA